MATIRTALAALVLCVAGPTFLSLTIRNELRARALDDHGVVVVADVVEVQPDRDTDAGSRVTYRFVADGSTFEGASRHLRHGDVVVADTIRRVEVRYLPEDPTISAPTRAATTRTQVLAFVVSGAMTMAGLALVLVLVSTKRKTGRFWA